MIELSKFIGIWRASDGFPFSTHIFTWEQQGSRLQGRWVIEAPNSPALQTSVAERPGRIEMQVGEPWLEDDILLFHVNGGPFVTAFRLVSEHEAVVGAAVHKLPAQFMGLDTRSIRGHQVRLTRQWETAG